MNRILLLHGWGFSAAVYASLIESLADEYEVMAPDMPGYGANDGSGNQSMPTDLTTSTIVIGWSLGAMHAMQLALRQHENVKALILIAATPCFVNRDGWQAGMQKSVFDEFQQQVIDDPAMAMKQFIRLNAGRKPNREVEVELSELSAQVSDGALTEGMVELAAFDLRRDISTIETPVLLLHAADDRLVPASASVWLEKELPNASRIEYQIGGHAFFLQQTEALAEHVRAMT